ncbi:hypothetical protein HY491_00825 [Candidatus Woesearchaeota archaeon]|nr:hypothetical protein [Candidatus Woesearchaeota archaeon]
MEPAGGGVEILKAVPVREALMSYIQLTRGTPHRGTAALTIQQLSRARHCPSGCERISTPPGRRNI